MNFEHCNPKKRQPESWESPALGTPHFPAFSAPEDPIFLVFQGIPVFGGGFESRIRNTRISSRVIPWGFIFQPFPRGFSGILPTFRDPASPKSMENKTWSKTSLECWILDAGGFQKENSDAGGAFPAGGDGGWEFLARGKQELGHKCSKWSENLQKGEEREGKAFKKEGKAFRME